MRRALLASLLLCMSCAVDDLTEVVVIIETEPAVRAQSTSLALKVTSVAAANDGLVDTLFDNSNAPWHDGRFTVGLSPKKPGVDSRYRVEASAQVNGRTIATARLISGFVVGQTRYVRMLLEDQCVGVLSCTPDTTCHQGACVGAEVDPTQFAPSSDLAPSSTTLPASTDVPTDGAVQNKPDAAQQGANDAATTNDAGVGHAAPNDAGANAQPPRTADTGTPTPPDASVRADAAVTMSVPDAGSPPPDAGTPPPDAGAPVVPNVARCKPGYYEGSFMGDYAYTLFNSKMDTKILPVSTTKAPVLSLVLVADADTVGGPSSLRINAGCMSGTMMAPNGNRQFFARMAGTLDCATGTLSGRLAGAYFVLNTDIDYPFTGALSAQLGPSADSSLSGAWDAVEPKDPNNISSGGGQGTWTASFVSDAAPAVSMDPCVDVVARP